MNRILENMPTIAAILGPIITFFAGRKMKEIEVKKADADFFKSMQDVYDRFVNQTDEKIQTMSKEINNLRSELHEYKTQCSKCSNNKIK